MKDLAENRRHRTPPEIARQLGVSVAKVQRWIRDGELVAVNLASRGSTRPRYSVSAASLEAFLNARTVVRPPTVAPRQRSRQTPTIKEFFK